MWNVLLVEDEVFVRRSLKKLIRWEEMGFTIAGEAGDGREALAMMRANAPDLVIADIVMPGMDGVELLKQAREEGLESSFVMLTCMNEFEYARQALEFGASAYMLKLSMNGSTLAETLAKVNRELLRNLQMRSQAVSHPFQQLYREVWQSFHAYGGNPEEAEERRLPPDAAVWPDAKFESVWIGSFLHGARRFTLDDFHGLDLVTPGGRSVIHTFTHSGQTTVFVWNPAAVRTREEGDGPFPWTAACSDVAGAREMPAAWHRVLRTLDRAWYEECSGLLVSGDAGLAPVSSAALAWKTEREWLQSFEQHRLEEFRQRLQAGWKSIEERRLPMAVVKDMALRVDRSVSRIAGYGGTDEERLLACVSHRELGERLLANADRYAKRSGAGVQPLTNHPEIDKALGYIHRHYDRDVTLRAMAVLVAMDETYFSGLFKKKTGVTLIHYIQRLRVDMAKKLLAQTELPIAEVGERVGFPNANYFIKIFKRWTALTPSEYRSRPN
ncbi:helix-turn-helix domain-containing protein [Paenibacillus sp. MBLB4367]|uniref:helix-turn-helix domain-containing protein n=1 Tax=Paenibacillus sp. MBLB4367 TaxID=3384767 RepID=UPI0039081907